MRTVYKNVHGAKCLTFPTFREQIVGIHNLWYRCFSELWSKSAIIAYSRENKSAIHQSPLMKIKAEWKISSVSETGHEGVRGRNINSSQWPRIIVTCICKFYYQTLIVRTQISQMKSLRQNSYFKVPSVKHGNTKCYLKWCHKIKSWSMDAQKKVIWLDKSSLTIFPKAGPFVCLENTNTSIWSRLSCAKR